MHLLFDKAPFQWAQSMQTIATDIQMQLPPAATIKSRCRNQNHGLEFDFGRQPKDRLLGPARYLMLVRRCHADRSRLSWSFRSLAK
jgi:hypothetical protein